MSGQEDLDSFHTRVLTQQLIGNKMDQCSSVDFAKPPNFFNCLLLLIQVFLSIYLQHLANSLPINLTRVLVYQCIMYSIKHTMR